MNDDDLRQRLIEAGERFPIEGRPADLRRRVVHRRQVLAGLAAGGAALAAGGVGVLIPAVVGRGRQPDAATSPMPDPGPTSISAVYIGSEWLLASVTDAAGTIQIPAEIGASIELTSDGRIGGDDGVNGMAGRFTGSGEALMVGPSSSTLVGYFGHDPRREAAIRAIGAIMHAQPDDHGVIQPVPHPVRVIGADGTWLVLEAAGMRMAFVRVGPASRTNPSPAR